MRKVIQIAVTDQSAQRMDTASQLVVTALCDDGTAWVQFDWGVWQEMILPPGCAADTEVKP